MPDFDALLRQIPIDQIAKKLGVEHDVAEDAVKQALPTIVAGLSANAKDTAGAASLEKALAKHKNVSRTSVDDIDTADGEKIVRNVFGARQKEVVAAVAGTSAKADESIIQKILPIVAPIVLSWLASQFFGKKSAQTDATPATSGGIGDILGGLLGGGGGKGGGDALGGLGGMLGGLLGGGKR